VQGNNGSRYGVRAHRAGTASAKARSARFPRSHARNRVVQAARPPPARNRHENQALQAYKEDMFTPPFAGRK